MHANYKGAINLYLLIITCQVKQSNLTGHDYCIKYRLHITHLQSEHSEHQNPT